LCTQASLPPRFLSRCDSKHLADMAPFSPHEDAVKSDIRKALINTKANACPMAMRVAWHASGTFDKKDSSGGSDGATMRFEPEFTDDANAGLTMMIDMLKTVKDNNPEVSVADIWALAGCSGIEFLGGPKVPFAFGRTDLPAPEQGKAIPPNGRLPDALQGAAHLREVFGRMGLSDREIVALSGGHTLGRCHKVRSGFDGPWTDNPLKFDNSYFKNLMDLEWRERKWDGKKQYEDVKSGRLMMLPTDIALKDDPVFAKVAREYADNQDVFFKDFALAFSKLIHLGCKSQPKLAEPSAKDQAGLEFREYAMHGSTERMRTYGATADVQEQEANSGRTALHKAAFWGHIETTAVLLNEYKLKPNVQDVNGDTALHDAVRFGHAGVAEKLLAGGADPSIKNKAGKDCKGLAQEYGKTLLVSKL